MTYAELKERQKWTLEQKIDHTLGVIDQFYSRLDGKVFVSFSGGKDSTVLLSLCRIIDKDIKAVFCNTGNEYPDTVKFVRKLRDTDGYNIDIIFPEMKPKEVIDKFGFPLISKETSQIIDCCRNSPNSKKARMANGEVKCTWSSNKLAQKYEFLLHERFNVSAKCCYYLKKEPLRQYSKKTGLSPIIGIMACESIVRRTSYIRRGGAIHSLAKQNLRHWQYGPNKTSMIILISNIWRLRASTIKVLLVLDVCFVALDVNSRTTTVLSWFGKIILSSIGCSWDIQIMV